MATLSVAIAPRGSARRKLSNKIVKGIRHCFGSAKVKLVDRNEGANPPRRCESGIGEYALQASSLLQYERQVATRCHNDPAKTHGVHATGLVETRDRIEAIALKIRGVIEEPDLRVFRPKAIEVPG